ncbi:hypothetical protein KR054_006765 [Drosophila jambulina]|nr:hypothetical protein KR054_006765 [Drosophila jambulina]
MSEEIMGIRHSGMPLSLQQEAFEIASDAIDVEDNNKDIAIYIKNYFNSEHGPYWQCIVGSRFETSVAAIPSTFIHLFLGNRDILIFKAKDKEDMQQQH